MASDRQTYHQDIVSGRDRRSTCVALVYDVYDAMTQMDYCLFVLTHRSKLPHSRSPRIGRKLTRQGAYTRAPQKSSANFGP